MTLTLPTNRAASFAVWWKSDEQRGFGHILQPDGRAIFVHHSSILNGSLSVGAAVIFRKALFPDSRGIARYNAVCVRVVGGGGLGFES